MDATKKVTHEQRIVIGLVVVFAVVLVSTLKQMGILGRRSVGLGRQPQVSAQPPNLMLPPKVGQISPSPEATHRVQTQDPVAAAPKSLDSGGMTKPSYVAHSLRDPLKSLLLPQPASGVPDSGRAEPLSQSISRATTGDVPIPPASFPVLDIQGMVWGGTESQAIINHKVYAVGEQVSGMRIVSIDRNGVTVEREGLSRVYTPISPSDSSRAFGAAGR